MIDALGEFGIDVAGEITAVLLSSSDTCVDVFVCVCVCVMRSYCSTNDSIIVCRDRSHAFFLTGGRLSSFSKVGWNRLW